VQLEPRRIAESVSRHGDDPPLRGAGAGRISKGGIPVLSISMREKEAAAVGVCSHLGPRDYIASTHRGHGHSIAKGCDQC